MGRLRIALALALALPLLAAPAAATVRKFRIEGFAERVLGFPSQFPLPVEPPFADFSIEFTVDDEIADGNPGNPDTGVYPISGMSASINGETAIYVDALAGEGSIVIQAGLAGSQSWGVTGCRADCEPGDYDEARFRVVLAEHPLTSDSLTGLPPIASPDDIESFELGLFSSDSIAEEEATFMAFPIAFTEVPEPAGALALATGALVLGTARARIARRTDPAAGGPEPSAAR